MSIQFGFVHEKSVSIAQGLLRSQTYYTSIDQSCNLVITWKNKKDQLLSNSFPPSDIQGISGFIIRESFILPISEIFNSCSLLDKPLSQNNRTITHCPSYLHKNIKTSDEAALFLKDYSEGSFIVRFSSRTESYVASAVIEGNTIQHFQIPETNNNLEEEELFKNIINFVERGDHVLKIPIDA